MNRVKVLLGILVLQVLLFGCEQAGDPAVEPPTVADMVPVRGPNWSALAAIGNPDDPFTVSAAVNKQYTVGEDLRFDIESAQDGYVHIVQVDSADAVTVMLPHPAFPTHAIKAGETFSYPPLESKAKIRAQEPLGDSLLAFVITRDDVSIKDVLPELFQPPGDGRGLEIIDEDSPVPADKAHWSFAKYTINVAAK